MAERRMFTKKVTDDDNFMGLSSSAQALYFHLSMAADDDGFCNQVNAAMFKAHASIQDVEALLEKRYVYQFDDGVIVIKHWRMANALRKDRYTPTAFQEDLAKLRLKKNGVYTMQQDEGDVIMLESGGEASRPTARMAAYQNSSLPYSFDYKIRNAFLGRPCPICGATMAGDVDETGVITNNHMPSIQHNIPVSKGGEHELGNISVICHSCNVKIQDTPTGPLNADEVAEEWEKITGCRLVATEKSRVEENRIEKSRVEKSREDARARDPFSAFAINQEDQELTDALMNWLSEMNGNPLTPKEQGEILDKLRAEFPRDEWIPAIKRSTEKRWRSVFRRKEDRKAVAQKKQRDKWSEPVQAEDTERLLRKTREMEAWNATD